MNRQTLQKNQPTSKPAAQAEKRDHPSRHMIGLSEGAGQGRSQDVARSSPQLNRLKAVQEIVDQSPRVNQLATVQSIADNRPRRNSLRIEQQNPLDQTLQLKRTAFLSRLPIQRNDFRFGGNPVEKTTVNNQSDLDDEVEDLIDRRYGGYRRLFEKNEIATSPSDWAALLFDDMSEEYNLVGLHKANVRTSIDALKDKYREETLKHLVQTRIYHCGLVPYSADNLRNLLSKKCFIEDRDNAVISVLFETEGKFTKRKVEVGTGCIELIDANNRVVIIDSHQNKHQSPQLPELPAYTGGRGTRFASHKNLAWHKANTAVVVDRTIKSAVEAGSVKSDGEVYSPSKDAIEGIIYDLAIKYDSDTGKYVGSYHCNPVNDE